MNFSNIKELSLGNKKIELLSLGKKTNQSVLSNVALNKSVSNTVPPWSEAPGELSYLVDGINDNYNLEYRAGLGDEITVDLGKVYEVEEVIIYNGWTNGYYNLESASLYIDNTFIGSFEAKRWDFIIPVNNISGRYIKVLPVRAGGIKLNEIEVWAKDYSSEPKIFWRGDTRTAFTKSYPISNFENSSFSVIYNLQDNLELKGLYQVKLKIFGVKDLEDEEPLSGLGAGINSYGGIFNQYDEVIIDSIDLNNVINLSIASNTGSFSFTRLDVEFIPIKG